MWDATQLNAGTLKVAVAPSQPLVNSVAVSGGNLIFDGTNGVTNGNFVVLTSTNVANPLTVWAALATNAFDANGNFHVTNAIIPATPQRFYRLQLH